MARISMAIIEISYLKLIIDMTDTIEIENKINYEMRRIRK